MIAVKEIKMNYLTHPLGVGEMPHFGWVMESDRTEVVQSGFRLQLSRSPEFEEILYDSGRTESGESASVAVDGVELISCSRYYVRVKVWADAQGLTQESAWSAPASFVTALLQNEWEGEFISAETKEDRDNSKGTYLRKELEISGEIREAYLCSTALGVYHLYLNGEKVGEDQLAPGWTSYHRHLCYQTYDVTGLLRQGTNALGAHLGAGWYKGKMGFLLERNNYGEQTAFLMQLTVRYRDGRTQTVTTDESWTGCDSPVIFSEIYDGEHYDARREQDGWNCPGFVPAKEGVAWHPVETVEFSKEVLVPQPGCRVTIEQVIPAKRLFTTPAGDTVLDFGQNLTGWVRFRVRGQRGDLAHLRCFETLDAGGNAYFENLRTAKAEVRYICRGEDEEIYQDLFTFQGFRFAQLKAWPGVPEPGDFEACVVHSQMEETGHFACSHPLLNQLESNIEWSLRGNFLDIPTDCPQRDERMGWTGDAQIFCRTATFLRNTWTFFGKWLKDVALDQTPEGGVPHIVPDTIGDRPVDDWLLSQGSHSAAAWADVAVINPWTIYQAYGDDRILEAQFESMKKWIDFMKNHAVEDIWNYKLQFGDWVALDAEEGSFFGATPNDLTCTAYYAYSTGLFVKTCRVLKKEALAEEYQRLYERIVRRFQEVFLDGEGVMTVQTQTAHIVALYFGLIPPSGIAKTVEGLKRLLEKENGHLVTGFVGTPYFCHALSQNGCVKEAYELLLKEDFPSWLYQVKAGATTIWEHWDGLKPDGSMWSPDMNSFNHYAYGAIGEWLYRVAAGIEIDEEQPGYRHTIFAPKTGGGLSFVEASYESVYGRVASRWEVNGDRIVLKTEVPVNTTATICLEEGASDPAGVAFKKGADGLWTATVGSGNWEVSYRKQ